MKAFLLTCMCLVAVASACGGDKLVPDCSYMGEGATFCRSPDDHRDEGGYCCPGNHPYCGTPNTNCPVNSCCSEPAK